jgi:signal transduction histidine kinase
MRKLLPRSLRSRLIVSFGLLIFLSLFLGGIATVYLLKTEQERTARERVGRLAEPIALRAAILEATDHTPTEIEETLRQEYDVRILLIDRNATVVSDTGDSLRGQTIAQVKMEQAPPPGSPAPGKQNPRFRVQDLRQDKDDLLLFTAPYVTLRGPGLGTFLPDYLTVVAVEKSDVTHAWRDLLPRLFLAGGLAFFAGVVAASLIARSITRPLNQITAASEAMARGRYDQQIASQGSEEVRRLGQAFNDMARQVSASYSTLRDFLANVSHELKTPLTSIQGFSQAMTDGSLTKPEDYAEAGRIINDEALRMRGLVDDLLYLSQVEAGEVVMHFDRLNVPDLLLATRERFSRRAGQAGIELRVEAATTPPISADARRLEQALANIVDNAVRYTPPGGRITLRSTASDGHIQLAVHNTGSVIPPEALPHIFDRFFQADPERARAEGNSGLGLAITHEIIEAHGGNVAVTSSAVAGTEFVITLPREAAAR